MSNYILSAPPRYTTDMSIAVRALLALCIFGIGIAVGMGYVVWLLWNYAPAVLLDLPVWA